MKRLLSLLLVLGLSAAAPSCVANATTLIFLEQGPMIGVIIALMTVVIAVAYMVGTAIHNANYIVFAKDELYHLGFSILLLLGFSGILLMSCEITSYFFDFTFENLGLTNCYTTGISVNYIAECQLKAAKEDAKGLSERYIQAYIDNLMDSTYASSIQIPLFNAVTAVTGAYKRIVANQYNMIVTSFLVPALMSLSMQGFVLTFINDNLVQWVLPIAFVLRFFPATRHMGNVFIAVVIGVYVLVPSMYAFNLAMYDVVWSDCSSMAVAACDNVVDDNSCVSNPAATCGNPDSFWAVARLIPQAFFLPNLTMVLLITFFSSINKALRVIG
ncbi:MAG: hypothetical protein AB1324_07900 [Candidatus Micrarchaeota archaeon]